MIENSEYKN